MTAYLNNFPEGTRGTYIIKDEPRDAEANQKTAERLAFAKKLINNYARYANITILLHCELRLGGWLLLWWPANEPRHDASDEILTGDIHYGR